MNRLALMLLCISILARAESAAEEFECATLAKQIAYNTITYESNFKLSAQDRAKVCSNEQAAKKQGLELITEKFGLTGSNAENFTRAICSENQSSTEVQQSIGLFSQVFGPDSAAVLQACIQAQNSGIKARTTWSDDGNRLDLELHHTIDRGIQLIRGAVDVSRHSGKMECRGELATIARNGGRLSAGTRYSLTCERQLLPKAIEYRGRLVRHQGATVKISTSLGDIIRWMPPIVDFSNDYEKRLQMLEQKSAQVRNPQDMKKVEVVAPQELNWGFYRPFAYCPTNHYVCGISHKAEGPQGSAAGEDDVATTGVRVACCPF